MNVWAPVKDSALAPPAVTVMLLAAAVESEIVPVPEMVNAPVLAIAIVPADLEEVSVPLLVKVLAFTFIVMLPVDATVVFVSIPVPNVVVVVVSPPLPGLILIVPPFVNSNACPDGGAIEIELVPALEIVQALVLVGPLMVTPLPAGLVMVTAVPDETLLATVVPFPDR